MGVDVNRSRGHSVLVALETLCFKIGLCLFPDLDLVGLCGTQNTHFARDQGSLDKGGIRKTR